MKHEAAIVDPLDGTHDCYRVGCSCGWGVRVPTLDQAAVVEARHLLDNRLPDPFGNSYIDFSDGTGAVHCGEGLWRMVAES